MIIAASLQYAHSSKDTSALFLTPYIEACEYEEAKKLSKMDLFEEAKVHVTAHSGYITVKNATGNNLFFLLTKAEENSSSTPLLLWTQGGPGLSALFGLFLENGPVGFAIDENRKPKLYPRTKTLQKNMDVIYLDLPVGAGFSFTTSETGYPKTLDDVVNDVIEFLEQFLKLFSEYQGRPIYIAGESYGARYSVAIANRLLKNTEKSKNVNLSLKGVISGNGFLGPIYSIADSSKFLYSVSMLTAEDRDVFAKQFQHMQALIYEGQYKQALGLLITTIFADPTRSRLTLFQNLTSYNDHASPLHTERPFLTLACFDYLSKSTELKKAIHVGANASFQYNNKLLLETFAGDWLVPITSMIKEVLEKSSILFYTGQIDALFPSVNQRDFLATLQWTHDKEYQKAPRSLWKPYPEYYGNAGYKKEGGNLIDVVLLGMSHYGAVEKSEEVYHLITEFVTKKASVN